MGGNFATRCSWSTQVAETVFRKHAALDASLLQVCRSSFCLFVHTDKAQGYWLWEATSPPPTIYSLLSSKTLWLFSTFEMCLNTSVKKNFKKNVCWAHSDPCIYCDDTDCYKLFPAIIPLHIELMDMGPTCSVTSGDMCSVSLPAPALCCVLSALLTLCQISKRWLGRCWARD